MSKNISLSSAKAFPSWTSFSSRFGGLRPSFLKNRAHHWRRPSAISHVSDVGPTDTFPIDQNLDALSVDVGLGRIRISPHATFAYPTTHVQLLIRFEHATSLVAKALEAPNSSNGSDDIGSSSPTGATSGEHIDITDLPQSAIRSHIRDHSMKATERFVVAQQEKLRSDQEEAVAKGVAASQKQAKAERTKKQRPTALPHEARQLLIDTPSCELYSKRINAWSLYAKAQRAFMASQECYCVVMATDCRVLPAAEVIANTFPHRFMWLPMEVPWLEAGPLAPDSVFRSGVHSTKQLLPLVAEWKNLSNVSATTGVPNDSIMPQQPVQLRALVPIVDPAIDLSLDMEAIYANPIATSIYGLLFGACGESSDLSTITFIQCRIRDTLLMPLLLGSEESNATMKEVRASVIRRSSTAVQFVVDKRALMRCCGWHHFSRWLGGIDKVVDDAIVRLI